MALDIFPFYHLSNNQLQDEFATSREKSKEILENANLQKFHSIETTYSFSHVILHEISQILTKEKIKRNT